MPGMSAIYFLNKYMTYGALISAPLHVYPQHVYTQPFNKRKY